MRIVIALAVLGLCGCAGDGTERAALTPENVNVEDSARTYAQASERDRDAVICRNETVMGSAAGGSVTACAIETSLGTGRARTCRSPATL